MSVTVRPGQHFPLGVHFTNGGANVAVYSVCRRRGSAVPVRRGGQGNPAALPGMDAGVWHGFIDGVEPGQLYGFRVVGPYEPAAGQRCNPAKLLIDPYARAISGKVDFGPAVYGHDIENPAAPSELDSADAMPRSVMVAALPSAGPDSAGVLTSGSSRPARQLADSVIYEVHVKGFTELHPGIPAELRGTYAGLAHPVAIDHLRRLGITAVELLPVHHSIPEAFLVERGLTNYWGYNTVGFFAPNAAYSAAVRAGNAGRRGRRVPGHGAGAARRRYRGDLGCRLQPHLRGRSGRPDPVVPRFGQRGVLPAQPGQQGRLHRYIRVREFAECRQSRRACG